MLISSLSPNAGKLIESILMLLLVFSSLIDDADPAAPAIPSGRRGNMGWVLVGTAALLLVVALAAGMTARDDGGVGGAAAKSEDAPTPPSVPVDAVALVPQEDVGDASLLATPGGDDGSNGSGGGVADSTEGPTASPTASPAASPTFAPSTAAPSTAAPTSSPTTVGPSASPSAGPTNSPSAGPSASPTTGPTDSPTAVPTNAPTESPTPAPSSSPTRQPTNEPTKEPTKEPTAEPTNKPTAQPTNLPTSLPTNKPIDLSNWGAINWDGSTSSPSLEPTQKSTPRPTNKPVTKGPTNKPVTKGPTNKPTESGPFFFGDTFYTVADLGIEVSAGLTARVVARTGQPVPYPLAGDESSLSYHAKSDAAGIILQDPANPLSSGYAYVTNSEVDDGGGGVYAIYFDKDGNALDYRQLLKGTSRNCGGGGTPWNTWVSCEESEPDGQCWQIGPYENKAEKTVLGGDGGEYESVACDHRNPGGTAPGPVFFTTEDLEDGALRRFAANGWSWDALHTEGDTTFLEILDDSTFRWTTDEDAARSSASEYYKNSEGIQFHEGKLYFMAKEEQKMFVLDLETNTYFFEFTGKKFYGEGTFADQPDQNLFGPTRKYIYFTEDAGDSPGVYARYGADGTYFTLFQGIPGGMYDGDETIGIALSPDHKRLYAGIQDAGVIFEITRDDSLPFE